MTNTAIKSMKRYLMDILKPWRFAFWNDKYYNLKWYFWAIYRYHKIVKKMRPWDGNYIYDMVNFQLELLLPRIENGHEEDISKMKKVKDIKRLIELLNNHHEENYMSRCGYDDDFNFNMIKIEGKEGYSLETTETPEQKEKNNKAINESLLLQEQEEEEIGKLFSKIPSWWD